MSWQHTRSMSPEQLALAIATLKMKPAAASRFVGCSYRQMVRMLRGERAIPVPIVLLLGCMIAHRTRPLVPRRVPGTY
jgi:hypothetical protein